MKRIAALFLCACLILCGCGPQYEVPYASTDETTTAPITEPTTEPTTVPTEPPVLYRHPLTGAPLSTPYTGRPTAVVINNIKKCMPQHGISDADMIYEFETEGGITRLLAIYSDLTETAAVGPIRSARTYFISVAASYDAPLIHCGGSQAALAGQHDIDSKLSGWEHIDQRFNGKYFYRDKDRRANGYALEHTLFSTGELLIEALAKKKFNTVNENGVDYGLQFADEVALNGETATKITVTFRGKKTTTMTYNEETGLYEASQYKAAHIDKNSGETMAYRNVLVLQSKQTKKADSNYTRSYYNLNGKGEGYFACGGQVVPIKWSRKSVNDPFVYTLADGTPVTLGVGKTYVGVVDTSSPAGIAYQ